MLKTAFEVHNPSGTVNQLMSLEMAVAIQHITKRKIDVYNINGGLPFGYSYKVFSARTTIPNEKIRFINNDNLPSIVDLVDFPNKDQFTFFDDDSFLSNNKYNTVTIGSSSYICDKESSMTQDEQQFASGRNRLYLDPEKNYNIKQTLSFYSSGIYNKSEELKNIMSQVIFKKEYLDLANKICKDLGQYSSIHARLSDHKYYNLTEQELLDAVNSIKHNNKIIISTCQESNNMFKSLPRHCIMFSSVMKEYIKDFYDLPMYGDVVYDIINLLVMSKSNQFIGTQGSTYSAYATRYVKDYSYMSEKDHVSKNKYEWSDYNFPGGKYTSWWREWPNHASLAQW